MLRYERVHGGATKKIIGAVTVAVLALSLESCAHEVKTPSKPAAKPSRTTTPACPRGQEQAKGAKPGVCVPIVPVLKKGKATAVTFNADTAEQGYLSTTGDVTLKARKSVPEIPGDSYNEPQEPQRGRFVGVRLKVKDTGRQELWMGSASYVGDTGLVVDDVDAGVYPSDMDESLGDDITGSYPKPGTYMDGGLTFDIPKGHGFIVFTDNEGNEQFKIKV